MLGPVVDWFKGLLGGKGGTQVGSRNVSTNTTTTANKTVSVTAGQDASHVQVADTIHITNNPPPPPPPVREYHPTPEEADILGRLAESDTKTLHFARVDSPAGYLVLIDLKDLAEVDHPNACLRYVEAVRRLQEYRFLANHTGDGEVFHLTDRGRDAARQIRGKCPWCAQPRENVGSGPNEPPVWVCANPKCLKSKWHSDARCGKCGKRAARVERTRLSSAVYQCEDGHTFDSEFRKK